MLPLEFRARIALLGEIRSCSLACSPSMFSAEFTFCLVLMILLCTAPCVRDLKERLEPRLDIESYLEEAEVTPGLV